MEAKSIKEYIFNNNQVEYVLEQLGMHHIKWHSGNEYVTCGMPDGDNPNSTTVYNDSFLGVIAYTRDIKDAYGISDIISLVTFIRQCFFTESINWLCDLLGLDYYSEEQIIDTSISYKNNVLALMNEKREALEIPLKPIDEGILKSYLDWNNTEFLKDNISRGTQTEFRIRDRHSFT
jgi:DNA primase